MQENDGDRAHEHRGPHVDASHIPCLHAAGASPEGGGGGGALWLVLSALPARRGAAGLHSHDTAVPITPRAREPSPGSGKANEQADE